MEGKIAFLEKFKKYSPREEYRLILENAYCERVRVEKELKMIEARVSFPEIVDKDILYTVEGEICEAYGINTVKILPQYPKELFSERYIGQLITELQRIGAVSKGFFGN